MCFQKQHYESIVPEKSGIIVSLVHRMALIYFLRLKIAMRSQFNVVTLWLTSQLAEGYNPVKQKAIIVHCTSEFSRSYHMMR